MPTIARNGHEIHYEVSGAGPALVLTHSFLCSTEMWAPQVEALAAGHRVVNVDVRGHGRSTPVDRAFDLYELVDDVLAVLDELEIDAAIWAGLSIGGMISMRAALVAPERVTGLILLDTHAGREPMLKSLQYQLMAWAAQLVGIRRLVSQVERIMFGGHTLREKPDLVRAWRERFLAVSMVTIRRGVTALRTRDPLVAKLADVTVPTLVIVGDDDRALPPAFSQEIVEAMPNAALVVVENAGHLSTVEQPEVVTGAMLGFLAKCS